MVEEVALGAVEDEFDGRPAESSAASSSESSAEVEHYTGEKVDTADAGADVGDVGFDKGGKPSERHDEDPSVLDAVASLLVAPDPQTFLGGLIGSLSPLTMTADSGDRSVGAMLRLLGHALADALDDELAFQEIVDALDRRHLQSEVSVAVVAAFLARIASAASLRTSPAGMTPAEAATLVRAAAPVVREALNSGRARAWHLLPQLAATVQRRGAQRRLPIATLAAALPRLWAQMGPGPHDTSTPEPDRPWSGMTTQPRLMILNGPVEIVILGR